MPPRPTGWVSHLLEASLRPGSVGYVFWRDKFIQDVQRYLAEQT